MSAKHTYTITREGPLTRLYPVAKIRLAYEDWFDRPYPKDATKSELLVVLLHCTTPAWFDNWMITHDEHGYRVAR